MYCSLLKYINNIFLHYSIMYCTLSKYNNNILVPYSFMYCSLLRYNNNNNHHIWYPIVLCIVVC